MKNATSTLRTPAEIAESILPQLSGRERELDASGRLARENLQDLRQSGLLKLSVPAVDGGLGGSLADSVEVLRILAQAAPSTALMLCMHNSTLAHYLLDPGLIPAAHRDYFREQREWAWKETVEGRIFGVANSEPGAHGDVSESKATLSDDGKSVTGLKSFASMGLEVSYFMLSARDTKGEVDYYLVQNDEKHVHVESSWDATGMRSSESATLAFDSAPVIGPLAYPGLLGGTNKRHWSTLSFTAIFIGIAESLLDDVRHQSEAMLQKIEAVDLHLTLQASRSYLRHCVDLEPEKPEVDYLDLVRDCKLFITRALASDASALFLAQGGGAYRFSSPISRKFRDLLAGPMLRPPVGTTFDRLWDEISGG